MKPPSALRPAALLLASALTLVGLGSAPPARADHTPVPDLVVIAGSLQDELGCPGDWQPECRAAALQPVAGQDGVFSATFEVPAGSYEYKAALNGSWTENYGADGASGGSNITLKAPGGPITFTYDHKTHMITDNAPRALLADQAAHWLSRTSIAVKADDDAASYKIFWSADAALARDGDEITGGSSATLPVAGTLSGALLAGHPQLAGYRTLTVPAGVRQQIGTLLTDQLAVAAYDADGKLLGVTGVQLAGVLDDVYAKAAAKNLGPTWTRGRPAVSVWAPTAQRVRLLLTDAKGAEQPVTMFRDRTGVWSVRGAKAWKNRAYRFEVTVYAPSVGEIVTNQVTDPYSLGLTTNSTRSLLIDLDDPALIPSGWSGLRKPKLTAPEYSTIYELHLRDFSIGDETVPAAERGTYLAFTHQRSDGMRHLRRLAKAGMNTVHLLPVNDIASIPEADQKTPDCDLESYAPDGTEQQACIEKVADTDGFNWGYDPLHYTTPEGSYSTDPRGTARNREFRQMVMGLNQAGQRVVMDVVYNHTPAAGQDPKSVLDQVVPGYYQRLSATGQVETSTCCANTATENTMMGKLMIDSVVTWATKYKVDGFRFDLMGHQPKAAMVELRNRLNKLTLAKDGVDGKKIYLYGEGWNFGEVANNARFVQASQLNMAGTGIGTFNDRIRDAVRGGGPSDENPRIQGFASGAVTDPNGDAINGTAAEQKARLLLDQDRIKVGLAGNLGGYRFVDRTGATVTGAQVDYNGAPTGYAADPQETVNYVEAHDNETLFDALVYKLPRDTSMDDRIRMQTIALSTTALGQGVSFWHAGGEMLRSKSLDRNSYNSGDWFNVYDVTHQTNGFGRGLPPKADNEAKWPIQEPLLADESLQPSRSQIDQAQRQAEELLRIRASSPLFHLDSSDAVQQKVSFPGGGPDQAPGVITMVIDDTQGRRVDSRYKGIVVVFNATPDAVTQQVSGAAGERWSLHPVQARSSDSVTRSARFSKGTFRVPARTVSVFVRR